MPVTTSTDQETARQAGDGEVVGARRARQGFRDKPILWVLTISLVLVVLAFGIAFVTNNKSVSKTDDGFAATTRNPAAASAFDAPEPAPKVVRSN